MPHASCSPFCRLSRRCSQASPPPAQLRSIVPLFALHFAPDRERLGLDVASLPRPHHKRMKDGSRDGDLSAFEVAARFIRFVPREDSPDYQGLDSGYSSIVECEVPYVSIHHMYHSCDRDCRDAERSTRLANDSYFSEHVFRYLSDWERFLAPGPSLSCQKSGRHCSTAAAAGRLLNLWRSRNLEHPCLYVLVIQCKVFLCWRTPAPSHPSRPSAPTNCAIGWSETESSLSPPDRAPLTISHRVCLQSSSTVLCPKREEDNCSEAGKKKIKVVREHSSVNEDRRQRAGQGARRWGGRGPLERQGQDLVFLSRRPPRRAALL